MFRTLLTACSVAICMPIGLQATANDVAEVRIKPGLWEWSYSAELAQQPFGDKSKGCVAENDSKVSLQSVADKLGQGCVLQDVVEQEAGYIFGLTCDGLYTGEADVSITNQSEDSMTMSAIGFVEFEGVQAKFVFDAEASHVGVCEE